jgi:hypothetical protein
MCEQQLLVVLQYRNIAFRFIVFLFGPTFATFPHTACNAAGVVTSNDVSVEFKAPTSDQRAAAAAEEEDNLYDEDYSVIGIRGVFMQVSLVFLLISGYYAMILTNWATLQKSETMANGKTGQVAMWIQASGQWIAFIMYLWSLLVPKLFPDRDFS